MKRLLTLLLMCSIASYISAFGYQTIVCKKTGKEFGQTLNGGPDPMKQCEEHCQGPCSRETRSTGEWEGLYQNIKIGKK